MPTLQVMLFSVEVNTYRLHRGSVSRSLEQNGINSTRPQDSTCGVWAHTHTLLRVVQPRAYAMHVRISRRPWGGSIPLVRLPSGARTELINLTCSSMR